MGLFCWNKHCWRYYYVLLPLGQGLTQKDNWTSACLMTVPGWTWTLLCDPTTQSWRWLLHPHLPVATIHQLLKTVCPSANYSIILWFSNTVLNLFHSGGAFTGSVRSVGSLGHIQFRQYLSLGTPWQGSATFLALWSILWKTIFPRTWGDDSSLLHLLSTLFLSLLHHLHLGSSGIRS